MNKVNTATAEMGVETARKAYRSTLETERRNLAKAIAAVDAEIATLNKRDGVKTGEKTVVRRQSRIFEHGFLVKTCTNAIETATKSGTLETCSEGQGLSFESVLKFVLPLTANIKRATEAKVQKMVHSTLYSNPHFKRIGKHGNALFTIRSKE